MLRLLLAAGLVAQLLLTGCTPHLDEVSKGFATAPLCCTSPQDFTFEPLLSNVRAGFPLDDTSPAWSFPEGKSYFKAFALPTPSYPYTLVVCSYLRGETIHEAYVLAPQILVLDEHFHVVRASLPKQLKLKPAGVGETWGLPYKLEVVMNFSSAHADERYVVIATSNELRAAKTSLSTVRSVPIILPGVVGAIPVGREEILIPHAPVGRLEAVLIPAGETL